jgi:hypothetical protein
MCWIFSTPSRRRSPAARRRRKKRQRRGPPFRRARRVQRAGTHSLPALPGGPEQVGRRHTKADRSPAPSTGTGREDLTTQGALADPEQDRRASRAARGGRRSARSVLRGGADHKNASGEDRGREAQGGFPCVASGTPRARAQLGRSLLEWGSASRYYNLAPEQLCNSRSCAEMSCRFSVDVIWNTMDLAFML